MGNPAFEHFFLLFNNHCQRLHHIVFNVQECVMTQACLYCDKCCTVVLFLCLFAIFIVLDQDYKG